LLEEFSEGEGFVQAGVGRSSASDPEEGRSEEGEHHDSK
jgi:hypothetical protein